MQHWGLAEGTGGGGGLTHPSTHRLKASGDSEEKEVKGMVLRMTEEKECRKVFVRTAVRDHQLPPLSSDGLVWWFQTRDTVV